MDTALTYAAAETKAKLDIAREIAESAFGEPSQEAVMAVFRRLCDECDHAPVPEDGEGEAATLH